MQSEHGRQQRDYANDGHGQEDRAPAVGIGLPAAQGGADGWRHAHGHAHRAHGKPAARQRVNGEHGDNWEQLSEIPPIDAIIHLAGKAHDTKNQSLAQEYFDINTELTKKIFDYFLQSDAETFVFFSSVKAAADKVESKMLTEDVLPKPVGPYGESKIRAEEYLLGKQSEAERLKKRVFIVRPAMIHGPGNKGNLNLLYNIVKKGIPWPLGAFNNQRSFCSINNISFVVEQLITQNVGSGIYHVCDDETLSTNELIEAICSALGKKTKCLRSFH